LNGFTAEHDLAFSVANYLIDLAKSIDVLPNTYMKGFAVKIIFSCVKDAYETMQQIGYCQLEGAIISKTDGFMKR